MSEKRLYPWLPESVEREGVLRIDFSSYKEIEACKRKAALAMSWRRETVQDAIALNFGRAIHEALDVRQKAIMAGRAVSSTQSEMEAALERCYGTFQLPPEDYRTLGRAKEAVGAYQAAFPDEPFTILASEQAAEKELGIVLINVGQGIDEYGFRRVGVRLCRVIWQGRTDGIWENPDTGERSIKDTKTSSRDEFAGDEEGEFSKGEARYMMSGQFMGYCWLFSGAEFGQITGAVLDQVVVRKPVARVTPRTPPQNDCKRRFFAYTTEQIAEWRRDTLANIAEWLTACAQGEQPPPMTRTNCAWPTVCGYFNSCVQKTEQARMERLAGPRFRTRTWNPMTLDTTKL